MIDTTAPLIALAKRLAPELADVPVYILSMDELAGIPVPRKAMGFADTTGVMGAAYVGRIHDYRGPGPLIALDDQYIRAMSRPGKFHTCLAAALVHELAHVLPHRPIEDAPRTERAVAVHTAALERHYAKPVKSTAVAQDPYHDWRWIRRCAHLFFRASGVTEVYAADVLGYPTRFSPLDYYLPLVAGEVERLRNASFADIEVEPAPPGLVEYFQADCNYHSRQDP